MAKTVAEIMNRELFVVRPSERGSDVLHYLVSLGVSGAPVVDETRRPVGFVSWRDLVEAPADVPVDRVMSVPVHSVKTTATLEEAADLLCEGGHHHLVCLGPAGDVQGFVGSLDILRGVRGKPAAHPASFPHWDAKTGLTWSDERTLDEAEVRAHAPDGPGLYVLVLPERGGPDRVVWSGAVVNVRTHLLDMLGTPGVAPPHLADLAAGGGLWFRAALAPSARALLSATRAG